jgi:hypothetical protein
VDCYVIKNVIRDINYPGAVAKKAGLATRIALKAQSLDVHQELITTIHYVTQSIVPITLNKSVRYVGEGVLVVPVIVLVYA